MNAINNAILQRFQAATANMADDQIVQYGDGDQLGNGTRTAGALSRAIGITQDAKNAIAANNRVRQDFLDAVRACFDNSPFAELPKEVLAAFQGTHASSAAGDLGLVDAGRVTSGKPLTARRIRAVLSAVQTCKSKEAFVKTIYGNLQRGNNKYPVIDQRFATILRGYCTNVVDGLANSDLRKLSSDSVESKIAKLAKKFANLYGNDYLFGGMYVDEANANYRANHQSVTDDNGMLPDCKKGLLMQFFYVLEQLNRSEETRVCDDATVQAVKNQMATDFGYDDSFADGIVWKNDENVAV